jgi:hypothetical protein
MSTNEIFALGGSKLNPFLFAEVGVEANGQQLSVVSLLAREGKDPWKEAARLAAMPIEAAVECLGRAIAVMPASPWSLPAATVIAGRLVAMLPAHAAVAAALRPAGGSARFTQRPWIAMAIGLALMLGAMALRSWFAS